MLGPHFTFAFILATLLGALCHLLVGGDGRRLAFIVLSGWLGFALGHAIGLTLNVALVTIGGLHLGMAVLGALLMLVVGVLLTPRRAPRRASRR